MLLGAIVFITIFGIEIINPLNTQLIKNGYVEKDIAQHYGGWLLYRNSPWQFPLGLGENIAIPYGETVTMTDSIPLFAIIFKLFSFILPQQFQYFGIFAFLCYVLQGAFSAKLISLFSKNKIFILFGTTLFLIVPILIERTFRHTSLTAHFLIIAGLYYYFKNKDGVKKYTPFFILNILAITIHPYFLPFTFGIMFALVLEDMFLNKQFLKSPLYFIISIILTVFVGWIIGAFGSASTSLIPYGVFNMNLNALYNPLSKGFDNWSQFLQVKAQGEWQIDGFNYLGLGIMIAILVGIIILFVKKELFSNICKLFKEKFGIVITCFILTVFAISNNITFGGLTILSIPLPKTILNFASMFRSSGRFANLLVYLLILFAIYSISKIQKKYISIIILAIIFTIQLIDINNVLIQKHKYFYNKEQSGSQKIENRLNSDFWLSATKHADNILLLSQDVNPLIWDLAVISGEKDIKVNIGLIARSGGKEHQEFVATHYNNLFNGIVEDNTIYIIDAIQKYMHLVEDEKAKILLVDNVYVLISIKLYNAITPLVNVEEIFPNQLMAASHSDPEFYTNGVYENEGIIMVDKTDTLINKLNNAKTITCNNITVDIDKVVIENPNDSKMYIYIVQKDKAYNFAFPSLISIDN